jgi:hypothetical protein
MKLGNRESRLMDALWKANEFLENPGAFGAIPLEDDEVLDLEEVNKLSLQLIELSIEHQEIRSTKDGGPVLNHGALSPVVINTLAIEMLEACVRSREIPPNLLVVLLRQQLGGYDRVPEAKDLERLVRLAKMRETLKENPDIGPTELSKVYGIDKSTASRWLKEEKKK